MSLGQDSAKFVTRLKYNNSLQVGAEQTEQYLAKLQNKTIAVVANQTSVLRGMHLVDYLLSKDIKVKTVFAPEHGFRGQADAGEHLDNTKDELTGLPIISLYGNHKKPTKEDLEGIDIVIFDIQDVGARFYTYISTMHYVMEACAENSKTLLILDRPNPNGFYVDGPVLEKGFESFVGMHQVPLVHGMTIAEYANMVNGEKWLKNGMQCKLESVLVKGYTHSDLYKLPEKPSPNLRNMNAIFLYPSLCLFEGTIISVGRGTEKPFEVIGCPNSTLGSYAFIPANSAGAKKPLYENQVCKGFNLSEAGEEILISRALNLSCLINFYKSTVNKETFFNDFFNKLAGNATLKYQIVNGKTESEIRQSWQADVEKFKQVRKKYLLYPDFNN
jgi:uncharacterized protein YbbC (DUF1343 family)